MMPAHAPLRIGGPEIARKHGLPGASSPGGCLDKELLKRLELPAKLSGIFKPARYKIFHGGRGGAKSRSISAALVVQAAAAPRP